MSTRGLVLPEVLAEIQRCAEVQEDYERYLTSQSELDELADGDQPDAETATQWAKCVALILYNYTSAINWNEDGTPKAHFPMPAARAIRDLFASLGQGHTPPVIAVLSKRRGSELSTKEFELVMAAARYVWCAKSGYISVRAPVRHVATLYGVDARTVSRWANNFAPGVSMPRLLKLDRESLSARLREDVESAAEAYRLMGRGKVAIRNRDSKRKSAKSDIR